MRSRPVLTLGLLFCLSFGAVLDVTRAYFIPEESEESQEQTTTGRTTPSNPKVVQTQSPKVVQTQSPKAVQTQSPKGSIGQEDSSAILFPSDDVMKCEDTHTCSTLDDCTSFSKTNAICGWNDTLPLVCCLKPPSIEPLDIRIFPENECFRRVEGADNTWWKEKALNESELDYEYEDEDVVGGKDVKNITSFPFMVSLFKRIGKNRMFICGGVLISRKHVLTAAHCFLSRERGSEYDVMSGLVNRKSIENNTEPFIIHLVTNIHVHPNFKFPQLHDDIAILTIPNIDSYSHLTRPVCLPLALPESKDTGNATILGWGNTRFNGEPSDQLQEAHVDLVNRSICERTNSQADPFFRNSFPKGITPDIVCAGNTEFSEDACQGDSGGPLVVLDENNVYRLVGVVSAGFTCGRIGIPGVYTRVNRYLDWIRASAIVN